jgi:hypothetical protein
MENKIMDSMMNENIGFNEYSLMGQEDRGSMNAKVYGILKASYEARDMNKFGRLSFKEYVKGITPSEGYETEYSKGNPSPAAKMYGEVFGSDMDLMKQAAIVHHENLPVSKGLYRQGE